MKIIVAGGRDFNYTSVLNKVLNEIINPEEDIIVSGDARGADLLGAAWASQHGVPIQHFPAYWDMYGKGAGYIRNAEMGEHADAAICFWDGKSRGTHHMIVTMARLGKPVIVFDYNGNITEKHHWEKIKNVKIKS
jgi:hypothetical protein